LDQCLQGLLQNSHMTNSGNKHCTLKPGCFLMNVACWAPHDLQWSLVTGDDPPSALWSVYSWGRERQSQAWNNDPSRPVITQEGVPVIAHPQLAFDVSHIHKPETHQGGDLSYISLAGNARGEVDKYFLRLTDTAKNWHYRFDGLPRDCNRAIQKYMTAPKVRDERWTQGRIRAVTIGQGGGWILHREYEPWTESGGDYLPNPLKDALTAGRRNGWTVNVRKTAFCACQ
jgi:hypothetical protein